MELAMISDTLTTVATTQGLGLGFSKFLLNHNNFISLSDDQQSPSSATATAGGGARQISAVIFDALAPPPVKYNNVKRAPRRLARKIRRTRRKSLRGDGADDGDDNGFYFDNDGPFGGDGSWNGGGGGGRGGSGGRGWNFDGFGGANWEDSSSSWKSYSDPAFDLVYELMCWVALSNCLHFAFKKVVRIVSDGFTDPTREKVQMRIAVY